MDISKIKDIANSILDRIQTEGFIEQQAIGRADIIFDGEKGLYWIVRQRTPSFYCRYGFIGNFIGTELGPIKYLEDETSQVITRDSKLGETIIMNRSGKHEYHIDSKKYEVNIQSLSYYIPNFDYEVSLIDALHGNIQISDDLLQFESLKKELEKYNFFLKKKEEIQNNIKFVTDINKYDELKKELENTEKEFKKRQEAIKKALITKFELTAQPILDRKQERIKRSRVFNGTLIINGGPGTGKTTSLIQRITFLIHDTILDYKKDFSPIEKDWLFNQNSGWIFFTPTELLSLYLRNAMVKENLQADNSRVVIWKTYSDKLIKNFGFLGIENSPFNNTIGNIFINDSKVVIDLVNAFESFIVSELKSIINNIKIIDLKDYSWRKLAENIFSLIENIKESNNLTDLIKVFLTCESYNSEALKFYEKAENKIIEISLQVQSLIIEKELISDLKNEIINRKDVEINTLEEDDTILYYDFDEEETAEAITKDLDKLFNLKLNRVIKKIVNKLALSYLGIEVIFSKKENKIRDLLKNQIKIIEFPKFADLIIFRKYYYNFTTSIESNVFNKLPQFYKKFRKKILTSSGYIVQDKTEKYESIIRNGNKILFEDEQIFILLFTFKLIYYAYSVDKNILVNSKSKYISTYKDNMKMVIAIDEAVDFSSLDLYCMSMLSYPRYRCVTLVGDLMQRLEFNGIRNWDSYKSFYPDSKVENLTISYRQTPKLLNIAKKLYKYKTNLELNFKSFYKETETDPEPLKLIEINEGKMVEWVANRLLEIYKKYSPVIPSIAIFVSGEDKVHYLTNLLNNVEFLVEKRIEAKPCLNGEILGDSQYVRVYNIQYIKGLEFEAVFFLNIDELTKYDNEMLSQYLYVGLSRATSYLAVTVKKEFPNSIKFIEDDFMEGNWL